MALLGSVDKLSNGKWVAHYGDGQTADQLFDSDSAARAAVQASNPRPLQWLPDPQLAAAGIESYRADDGT